MSNSLYSYGVREVYILLRIGGKKVENAISKPFSVEGAGGGLRVTFASFVVLEVMSYDGLRRPPVKI